MKLYSGDEAAERLGLPPSVLRALESEGFIAPKEQAGERSYYTRAGIDSLIQDLHARLQRASWREMEARMESVEERLSRLESGNGKGPARPFLG